MKKSTAIVSALLWGTRKIHQATRWWIPKRGLQPSNAPRADGLAIRPGWATADA